MPVAPPPEIFKAYDIRGLYPEELDGELAERIGRAFAHVLSKLSGKPVAELRVGLGRDMRLSAPELSARYREGLWERARTCSTPARWAARCSITSSARASWTAG